jgi:hypothetical protein
MFFVMADDAGRYQPPFTYEPVFMGMDLIRTIYGGW